MKTRNYWFPVRPASRGWGWGLPIAWQGWVLYALYFAGLLGGVVAAARYGVWIIILFSCAWAALFLAIVAWKGEPQRMRHRVPSPDLPARPDGK